MSTPDRIVALLRDYPYGLTAVEIARKLDITPNFAINQISIHRLRMNLDIVERRPGVFGVPVNVYALGAPPAPMRFRPGDRREARA